MFTSKISSITKVLYLVSFNINLGAPELADELINDKTALLNIKADGEFFLISYKWKAMPLEILFKLEEEFDVVNPLTPDSPDKVSIIYNKRNRLNAI